MEKFRVNTRVWRDTPILTVCSRNADGSVYELEVDVPRNVRPELASAEIEADCIGDKAMRRLEAHGRISSGSEVSKDAQGSKAFVRAEIRQGRESILEHLSLTAHITCDMALAHELRLPFRGTCAGAYTQESTWANSYAVQLPVIVPDCIECENINDAREILQAMVSTAGIAQESYVSMREKATNEIARAVIPVMTTTHVDMTTNLREWRSIMKMRTSETAHPDMRRLMHKILAAAQELYPVVFDDIYVEES